MLLLKRFFLLLLLCFAVSRVTAQVQQPGADPDALFTEAQSLAFSGKYRQSRVVAQELLRTAPAYTDAAVLIGRTYAWQHLYDSARVVLLPIAKQMPPHADALLTLCDVERWDGKPETALQYANRGLEAFPGTVPFLLAKAMVLQEMRNYPGAMAALETILKSEPRHKEATLLLEQVKDAAATNLLRADYQLTSFSTDMPAWHLGMLEYTRLAAGGRYIARTTYAERYGQRSVQGEVDAYPQLNDKTYAYLNAGIADRKLFPAYRLGGELYRLLPLRFEASVGARTLFFSSETVVLYTGHIGKYFNKQWLAFRPFLQRQENAWQTTGILQLRQYLQHQDEHFTLVLAKGNTPLQQIGFQEIERLDANRIGLEGQFRAGKAILVGGNFTYEYEEYALKKFRHRFTTGLTLQSKF